MAVLFVYEPPVDQDYYLVADQNPPFQYDENTYEEEEPEDLGL